MSARLPVGPTINEAFRFGVQRWGAILRFGWLPLLIVLVLGGIFAASVIAPAAMQAAESGGMPEGGLAGLFRVGLPAVIAGGVLLSILSFLVFSGVFASLFRLVALGEERPGLFHLRLDGPSIRVFLSYIMLGLIGAAIMGAAFLAGAALAGQSLLEGFQAIGRFYVFALSAEPGAAPPEALISDLTRTMKPLVYGWLIGILPTIYVNVKLAPFPAGSAAENRLLLFGAFAMTFGHFWSIFGVYVLFFVALFFMMIIFTLATGILDLLAQFAASQGGALAIVGTVLGIVVFIVSLWFQFFIVAVQYSIPAIIYRRLKTGI